MSHPFKNHLAVLSPSWRKRQEENLYTWQESFFEATEILGTGTDLVQQAVFEPLASTLSIAKIVAQGKNATLYIGSTLTKSAFQNLYSKAAFVDATEVGGYTRADLSRRAATIVLLPAVSYTPFERRICAGHELRHAQMIMNDFSKGINVSNDNVDRYDEEIIAYASAAPIADAELQGKFTPIVAKAAAFMITQEHPFDCDIRGILEESEEVNTALQDSTILWSSFKAIASTLVASNRELTADETVAFAEILTGRKHEAISLN